MGADGSTGPALMLMFPSGAAGRVQTIVAELKMRLSAADREQRAAERARQLDAEEVGRRADRKQAEREEGERLAATSGGTKQDTL
jgi:hypothetical protein